MFSTKDGMESLWTKMKQEAQQEAPNYLLIAKESTPQSIYERFRVSIKLPNVAPFDCIDEFKLKTIALWRGMQTKLSKYIIDNGGKRSSVIPKYEVIYRPNWETVKDILIRNGPPVTSVSCH